MRNFNNHLEEFERFSAEYLPEEKEVLVLTDDGSLTAHELENTWVSSVFFLAYVDLTTGILKKEMGTLSWLVSKEQIKKHSISYPYYFEKMSIYHLKVRELINKYAPENCRKGIENCLMVVEMLGKTENANLNAIKESYPTPITLSHEQLGEFKLIEELWWFEGKITWGEKEIEVFLEINIEDQETWHRALENLAFIVENQEHFDKEWREFSAKELTELANDWTEEEMPTITEEEFAERLEILSITIYKEKDYVIQYNSNNLFYGHQIEIGGNIEKGIEYADIWCGEGMKI